MASTCYTPGPLYRPATTIHSLSWGLGGGAVITPILQMARWRYGVCVGGHSLAISALRFGLIQQDRNVKREPLHTIQVASTGSRHLPVCLGQDSTTEGLRGLGQVALPSEPQFLHLQSGLVVTALPHRVTVIRI